MNIIECNEQLRSLINQYERAQISMPTYREQRKYLFDAIDKTLNGIEAESVQVIEMETSFQPKEPVVNNENTDKTQPYFSSKLGQCISFLKGNNER